MKLLFTRHNNDKKKIYINIKNLFNKPLQSIKNSRRDFDEIFSSEI